ncbi:MAG: hypothetical protein M3R01_03180 [Actinomycetota bacterium]|nr:hypothetical protein [Actinomycetota bacterium]
MAVTNPGATDDGVDDGTTSGPSTTTRPGVAAMGIVLLLAGLAALLLVTLSFSADNTGDSIDGRTATTSQDIVP